MGFEELAKVLPEAEVCVTHLHENKKFWTDRVDRMEDEMVKGTQRIPFPTEPRGLMDDAARAAAEKVMAEKRAVPLTENNDQRFMSSNFQPRIPSPSPAARPSGGRIISSESIEGSSL